MATIETNTALYAHLAERGWAPLRRSGERAARRDLGDRRIVFHGRMARSPRGVSAHLGAALSYPPLSAIEADIMAASHPRPAAAGTIDTCPDTYLPPRPELTTGDLDAMLARIETWARGYDIEAVLALRRGALDHARGVDHLAALALAGEVAPLERYDAAFREGRPHPFLPYVTAAMAARALELGREARRPA